MRSGTGKVATEIEKASQGKREQREKEKADTGESEMGESERTAFGRFSADDLHGGTGDFRDHHGFQCQLLLFH